jgi:hypothetical protein
VTTNDQPVPARVSLEDFIEAVTRGTLRALAAEEREVAGYALPSPGPGTPGTFAPLPHGPIIIGIPVFPPWLPPENLKQGGSTPT